jgi:hypothetical protein
MREKIKRREREREGGKGVRKIPTRSQAPKVKTEIKTSTQPTQQSTKKPIY